MVSSETESGQVDCGVGSIVWVRRRNGSWWPGKILGPDELSASHLMSPRSGTPVKLLGREDASVDWYNLEKSKRVKAFRCGEFDDFIQRAEASLGMPPKKREKYARREDAILHALELERQLDKGYGGLGCSSPDRSNISTDDFSGRGSQTSKYLENGNGRRLRSKSRQLSHKSSFFLKEKSTRNSSSIRKPKDHSQFSGDDDNTSVPPRMRGLQDLGLNTAPSEHSNPPIASDGADRPVLGRNGDVVSDGIYSADRLVNIERKSLSVKRKLSDDGLAEEVLVKRHNRSCPLAQVLESSENLPDTGSVCISEIGEEQPGVAKKIRCNLAEEPTETLTVEECNHAQMELSTLKREDNGSHPAELCERNASGSAEYTETDSSETDSAEDTDDELATLSDGAATIELEPKYIGRSEAQPEHGSISSEELDEVTFMGGTSFHAHHQESLSAGFGVSKWQLKGKRNNRRLNRRPLDPFDENLARRPCHMTNFKRKRGYGSLQDGYGSRAPRNASQNMFSCVDWAWDDQPASRGYWEESTEYFDSVNSYHHSGGRTMLVNVDLKVQSSYQREHVPMISLTSKINGQAIVGYPVRIEVLSNSSSESLLWVADSDCNFPETSDHDTALQPMWRTARRTANVRVPRPHASSALDNPEGIKHVQGFDRDKNVQKATVGGIFQKGSMTRTTISRPAIERTFAKKSGKRISLSSYQKVRTLSSIALQQKRSDQKDSSNSHQVDGAIKRETLPTVIACIPVKLVFSRLNEELVGRHQ
ncbi:hypothetical protein K7X08_031808 [Anisodus acutangulus]|uniref:PWWP domain-containing protein n=1 Tax=Anisodus acutangulus TaxID=402998 RepID=A0A9Q1MMD0_9SOLA|nr:hypothetical protein K7X08_031808 [Anisodus acutangulus]